jgi:hypothetical protein
MKLFVKTGFCFLISFCSFAQANPNVISVSPRNQVVNAEANTPIIITFDSSIDPATITDTSFYVFGRWSGVARGTVSFDDENRILSFIPDKSFYPGELVIVNISKRIRNTIGLPMECGYAWTFWIRTGTGTMNLVKTGEIEVRNQREEKIQTYGAYAGDFDKDGYTDFLVPNEIANDVRVFMNDKSGGYSDFTTFPIGGGLRPSTNEGADFNLDGLMDIAVGNSANSLVTVFIGDGTGGFTSIENYSAALQVRGLMVVDVNGDGFMDIVTANRQASNITILTNNGNGTFSPSDTIEAEGDGETTCSAADVNNDGIIDLFVGALSSREIILLFGDGEGSFNFHSKVSVIGSPWFTCTGDINNDGIADIVSANSSHDRLAVITCDSTGNLSEPVYYSTGDFPLSIDMGDIDGDGDLDVVTSNYSSADYTLYENDGTGVLINRRDLLASAAGSCSVFHDRDNDGDLDMTGVDEEDDLLILYENKEMTGINRESNSPKGFYLAQNYPNPFNPQTRIRYKIPHRSYVTIKVVNLIGQEIVTLVGEEKTSGEHDVMFNADDLSGGIYFYRIIAGEFTETNKMVLLK